MQEETDRILGELEKRDVKEDLKEAEYLSLAMILKLAENEVLCLDDLAELDSAELVELLSEFGIEDEASAGEIIMAARAHWFEDEPVEDAQDTPAEDA